MRSFCVVPAQQGPLLAGSACQPAVTGGVDVVGEQQLGDSVVAHHGHAVDLPHLVGAVGHLLHHLGGEGGLEAVGCDDDDVLARRPATHGLEHRGKGSPSVLVGVVGLVIHGPEEAGRGRHGLDVVQGVGLYSGALADLEVVVPVGVGLRHDGGPGVGAHGYVHYLSQFSRRGLDDQMGVIGGAEPKYFGGAEGDLRNPLETGACDGHILIAAPRPVGHIQRGDVEAAGRARAAPNCVAAAAAPNGHHGSTRMTAATSADLAIPLAMISPFLSRL